MNLTSRFLWVVGFCIGLAASAAAHAQAYQCRLPPIANAPQIAPDGNRRDVPITGYTLALSWSPEFCKPREADRRHAAQCSGANGRFGLVVHGLWPNGSRTWPQWCPNPNALNPAELRRNFCMMPSQNLMARQWRKHGSCMTRLPQTYFKVTRILWNSLNIPDYDRISREKGLSAGRIREAFVNANPGWRTNQVGVKLNSRGWLQELRLCYSKRFRPARCDSGRFGARDTAIAKIWRGL